MRNKPVQLSNSLFCGASGFPARSSKFSMISRSLGRGMLLRDRGTPQTQNSRVTFYRVFDFFLSGYRCFSCVLQNAPCRVPDVLQISTPALVSLQGACHVLKRSWRALQCPTKVLKDLTK